MSDLSDLHKIYPPAFRWITDQGFPAVSKYNPETGERGLQEIGFGQPSRLVVDLLTRERGYVKIKPGVFEELLTSVGSPPPPWPNDEDFKPAIACWVYGPQFGEMRFVTNTRIVRDPIDDVIRSAWSEPQAAEGQQPVIQFVDRVPVLIKSLKKTFYAPVIERIGWVERNQVPGWADRPPTVPLPKPLPFLGSSVSAPMQISAQKPATAAPTKEPAKASHHKARRPATKSPDDPPPFNDIPFGK
jgi:hypothetical protein